LILLQVLINTIYLQPSVTLFTLPVQVLAATSRASGQTHLLSAFSSSVLALNPPFLARYGFS